jgi:hypothetical protein
MASALYNLVMNAYRRKNGEQLIKEKILYYKMTVFAILYGSTEQKC